MIDSEIIYAEYNVEHIDLETAKEAMKIRLNFTGDRQMKMIIDATKVKKFTKEARDLMGSPEAYEGLIASAIVIKSSLGAMLANFYMRFSSQAIPTKLVSSKEEGIKWLQKK